MNNKLVFSLIFATLLLAGCTQPTTAATPTIKPTETATIQPSQLSATPTTRVTVEATQPAATTETPQASVPQASVSENQVEEITLTANDQTWSPSSIVVKKGKPVKLTIITLDVPHGLFIPEFGINKEVKPGAPAVVEFTPEKAGSFSFICNVFCGDRHSEMTGSLIVEEN